MKSFPLSPLQSRDLFWHFEHYSGCKNYFLIAYDPDNLHERLPMEAFSSLSTNETIANETIDGLLFLGKSANNLTMTYYNRDGTKALMCGNGLRCLSHYAFHLLHLPSSFSIHTGAGRRSIQIVSSNTIAADMGPIHETYVLSIDNKELFITDTGVPHALFVVSDLPKGPIEEEARKYRFHPLLGNGGANISYVAFKNSDVYLRTYERGVERETGACGTGACAAASILNSHFARPYPFHIHFASQEQALVESKDRRLILTASCEHKGSCRLKNPLLR